MVDLLLLQLSNMLSYHAGTAKVILDIGIEAMVRINRPACLGERVQLRVLSVDAAAGAYQLAESLSPPDAPAVAAVSRHPLASVTVPMSPLVHAM